MERFLLNINAGIPREIVPQDLPFYSSLEISGKSSQHFFVCVE